MPSRTEQSEQEISRLTLDREQASSSRGACPAGPTKLSKYEHQSKVFKCYICDFVGKTDGGLKVHMTRMHVKYKVL